MATVNKNFRIKHGLVVEGTTGTINGQNILTETGSDQYILDLIGGETLVKSTTNQFNVSQAGELSLNRTVVDGYYDPAGSAATAQSNAEDYADGLASNYDPAGSAATAQSNAEDYADGLASNYDPAGSAATAQSNAEDYADGLASNYDPAGSAATAQSNAEDYADGLASNYDPAGSAATAQSNAEDYADGLASNYDPAGSAATAQSNAEDYADGLASNYDPAGSAATAEGNAKDYTDLLLGDNTIDGTGGNTVTDRIATAVADLVDGAPALLDTLNELAAAIGDQVDGAGLATAIGNKLPLAGGTMTGAIAMGTNKITGLGTPTANADAATKSYVDDAQGAAEDYADGLASNYDAAGAASAAQTAAEGYADGLVDDLLDATTPFTEINVNDQAKQIAATASINTGSASTVYQWAKADYRSAKLLVKIDNGTHNEISEILVTLDSSDNVAITEYAIVGTNGSRGTISAVVAGSNVTVTVNPTNNSTVKVTGTLLK